jgi:pyrroline-5-carboxylate reductase
MQYELGFLGAGNMAEAIARAAIDRSVLRPVQMIAADPSDERRAVFDKLGVTVTADNAQAIRAARQVLVAVKPQVMAKAAADLAAHGSAEQVIISIMAGVTSDKLARTIGKDCRIVRVMPNTPLMVGRGMAGVALGEHARSGDEALTLQLFSAAGEAIVVEEKLIDGITAVSGSGPAYVFYLAEAMERAARELGLGDHSPLLVRQTILGAAELLAKLGEPPVELRRKVTSPGGTTEAAIQHMDGRGVAAAVGEAIRAAERRSQELGA